METELALHQPPSSLSRHLALVKVRDGGVGPEQVREERLRGSALLDEGDAAEIDARIDATAAEMNRVIESEAAGK